MNPQENLKESIRYFLQKSEEALASAEDELRAGRLTFAVNRLYYACFYVITAVFLKDNLQFKKTHWPQIGISSAFSKTGKSEFENREVV